MEESYDEDNECPFCGSNCFFEYIRFTPLTKTGKYEYNCPECKKSGELNLKEE